MAADVDFIVLNRGEKIDWASAEFRSISTEWHDLQGLDSEILATRLLQLNLDIVIDLGGWMDPFAMKALSSKPAKRIYKWVGGQSLTTGIAAFDGFLSDQYQSPLDLQPLYSEPLVLLQSGYVTYSQPDYMPQPIARTGSGRVIGIVANPAKVSHSFLHELAAKMDNLAEALSGSLTLRFIDRRYRHVQAKQRIIHQLNEECSALRKERFELQFLTPKDHAAYLGELAQLDAILDTFPYSGGLTTIEAYAVGVPCYTRKGTLFAQRHTYAHAKYCGLTEDAFDADYFVAALLEDASPLRTQRRSLLECSPRLNHQALANELLALLKHR